MTKINIPSKNISKLDLSNLNLKEIPSEIFELKNLKKLILSNNEISKIPQEITNLKYLEVLDISNNNISSFYAKLCELKNLKFLNLNNNKITSIPKQISKLENLRKISISNNRIKTLPQEFENLHKLISLNISKNLFVDFPVQVYKLKELKHLWISNLNLKTFSLQTISENLNNLKSIYTYSIALDKNIVDKEYFELTKIKGNNIGNIYKTIPNRKLEQNNFENQILNKKDNPKSMIFISYSHEDSRWLKKVQTNLKVLNHQDINFELWDDTRIKGGQKWKKEISNALEKTKVAILLISTEFLASDFIQNDELPTLLKKAEKDGCEILPLIVGHCRFTKDKLSIFQAINDPVKPLSSCHPSDVEKILVDLTNRVEEILENKN